MFIHNGLDAEKLQIVSLMGGVMAVLGHVLLHKADLIIPHVPVIPWFVLKGIAMVLFVCCMDLKDACVKIGLINAKFAA